MRTTFLALLFLPVATLFAQSARNSSLRPFLADIYFTDGERYDGILYDLTDTSIVIIPAEVRKSRLYKKQSEMIHVPITQIKRVRMERRGTGRLGLGLGLTGGMLLGAAMGILIGDDVAAVFDRNLTRSQAVGYGGFGGGLFGGTLGAIAVFATRDEGFRIDGDPARYLRVRPELTPRTLRTLTAPASAPRPTAP
ncbi:MAG: hypothetical protein WBA12_15930 [Catalinimonas sp.]